MDLSPADAAPIAAMVKSGSNGTFLAAFGASLLQGWLMQLGARYYQMGATKTERVVVTVAMIGATMATGLCMTELITQAVLHYDDFEAMGFIAWTSGLNCFSGGIVLHPGNRLVAGVISLLIVSTILLHTPWTQYLFKAEWKDMQDMNVHVTPFLYTEYGMTAFTDTVICIGTLYSLSRMGRAALPQKHGPAYYLRGPRNHSNSHQARRRRTLGLPLPSKQDQFDRSFASFAQLTVEAGISIPSSFSSSAIRDKSHGGFKQTTSVGESHFATDSSSVLELGIVKA
ncbi:hypothetical protein QFC21_004554 [Naganishia friedmannii]|uniref:Uncharacterized protein n=1 Tax=Naganishia friedmannii TaxID=89922 RepID=A0ACC2VGJ1_9TREE|nr:hypothetical protein QFC21_004554 [Naganishia friedmannii]